MLSIDDIKMILADVYRQKCQIINQNGSVNRLIELISLEMILHNQLITMLETEINQTSKYKKVG